MPALNRARELLDGFKSTPTHATPTPPSVSSAPPVKVATTGAGYGVLSTSVGRDGELYGRGSVEDNHVGTASSSFHHHAFEEMANFTTAQHKSTSAPGFDATRGSPPDSSAMSNPRGSNVVTPASSVGKSKLVSSPAVGFSGDHDARAAYPKEVRGTSIHRDVPSPASGETPVSFADVMKMMKEGKQLPGIKSIPSRVSEDAPTPSQMAPPIKPFHDGHAS